MQAFTALPQWATTLLLQTFQLVREISTSETYHLVAEVLCLYLFALAVYDGQKIVNYYTRLKLSGMAERKYTCHIRALDFEEKVSQ